MRIIKIVPALTLAVCIFFFSGCSDNDDVYEKLYAKLLPVKITNSEGETTLFSYNEKNRLTEVILEGIVDGSNHYTTTYRFKYVADNNNVDSLFIDKLQATATGDTTAFSIDTIGYKYEANNIVATRKKTTRTINLDTNGRLLHHEYTSDSEIGSVTKTYDYEYDTKGNILVRIENKGTDSEVTFNYTYDTYKGAFKNVTTPRWFLIDQLDIRSGFANNYIQENDVQVTYTYSANNYPRTVNRSGSQGGGQTIEYIQTKYSE